MEVLCGILVAAVLHQLLRQIEMGQRVGLLIAYHVVIGGDGLRGGIGAPVADGHLRTQLATLLLFLGRCLGVGLLVLGGGIVVFPDGIEGIGLLHGLIGPTTR